MKISFGSVFCPCVNIVGFSKNDLNFLLSVIGFDERMARETFADVLHNVAEEVYAVTPNQQSGRV
jgi:hypothetical protein